VDYNYDGMGRKRTESVTLDSGETLIRSRTYDNGWVEREQVVSEPVAYWIPLLLCYIGCSCLRMPREVCKLQWRINAGRLSDTQ
jgi:hypothetical protein